MGLNIKTEDGYKRIAGNFGERILASNVAYDNNQSGLQSSDVQGAIDEIVDGVTLLDEKIDAVSIRTQEQVTDLQNQIDSFLLDGSANYFDSVEKLSNATVSDGVIQTKPLNSYNVFYVNCDSVNAYNKHGIKAGMYFLTFKAKLLSGSANKYANKITLYYVNGNGEIKTVVCENQIDNSIGKDYKVYHNAFAIEEDAVKFGFALQVHTATNAVILIKEIVVSHEKEELWYKFGSKILDDEMILSKRMEYAIKTAEDARKSIGTAQTKYQYAKVAILGDSFSTLKDYIVSGNVPYYPINGNDVTEVQDTWWYKVIKGLKANLFANDSFSGSSVSNTQHYADAKDSFVHRIEKSFGKANITSIKPDVIFIMGGTNDSNAPIGDYKYSDWTDSDLLNFAPAYAYMLDYLIKWNPFTKIYCITQGYLGTEYKTAIATVCEHYDISNIVTNGYNAVAGHPTKAGMTSLANDILAYINAE